MLSYLSAIYKVKLETRINGNMINSHKDIKVISKTLKANGYSPNNASVPLLIFKKALLLKNSTIKDVKKLLKKNKWHKIWVDSVYDYHHYHSNTHEMLIVFTGKAKLQIGGVRGRVFIVSQGDVIFFPAGVSHKKISSTNDFQTIGAYPYHIKYNMIYLKLKDYYSAVSSIQKVKLPKTDPIYGKNGLLFKYWKK